MMMTSPLTDLSATPAHPSRLRDLTDKTLASRYRLMEIVGGGGMGTVYRAQDLTLEREVAVKVLDLRLDSDEDLAYQQRFAREARLCTQLSHRNIVEVFDAGHSDGVHFIAMELLKGQTLGQLLETTRVLSWQHALKLVRQMGDGLAFAHEMGLVHRDLKPANCFVVGEEERIKLLDFGLAKPAATSPMREDEVTRAAVVMGSPTFMAPEQARGESSPQSDLYSLGVVLFRMVSGQVPFGGRTPIEVIVNHVQAPVPWFEELRCPMSVPMEVELVIRRSLEKDPRARFVSVAAMQAGLDEAERKAMQPPSLRRVPPGVAPARAATDPAVRAPSPAPALAAAAGSIEQTGLFSAHRSAPHPRWLRLGWLAVLAIGAVAVAVAGLAWNRRTSAPAPSAAVAAPQPIAPAATAAPVAPVAPVAPAQVLFHIDSIPPGAKVRVGSHKVGVTPVTFEREVDSTGGATVELALELKGYQTVTFITTSMGPRFDLVQRLTRGEGRVTIAPSPPSAPATPAAPTAPTAPAGLSPMEMVALASPLISPIRYEPEQQAPPTLTEVTTRPRLIRGEAPRYTSQARRAKISGTAVVRCSLNVGGKLERCEVIKSVPLMDESILESMKTRLYSPALAGEQPVATELTIAVPVLEQ